MSESSSDSSAASAPPQPTLLKRQQQAVLLTIAFAFLLVFGTMQYTRFRARQRIAAVNPLREANRLRGQPTLLLYLDVDRTLPPEDHALPLAEAVGPSCQTLAYPGFGYGRMLLYDSRRILAFLKSHADRRTRLLLLHGAGQSPAAWMETEPTTMLADQMRRRLSADLQKVYPDCVAVNLGPRSWGDDSSLAALDQAAGPEGKVVLIGEHMGAVTMWRWAARHPERIAALVGISPVCDLQKIAETPFYGREIRRNYGSL